MCPLNRPPVDVYVNSSSVPGDCVFLPLHRPSVDIYVQRREPSSVSEEGPV